MSIRDVFPLSAGRRRRLIPIELLLGLGAVELVTDGALTVERGTRTFALAFQHVGGTGERRRPVVQLEQPVERRMGHRVELHGRCLGRWKARPRNLGWPAEPESLVVIATRAGGERGAGGSRKRWRAGGLVPLVDPLARPLGHPASPNPVPQNFLHGRLFG